MYPMDIAEKFISWRRVDYSLHNYAIYADIKERYKYCMKLVTLDIILLLDNLNRVWYLFDVFRRFQCCVNIN